MTALAAVCVAAAAVAVLWPGTGRRARRRRILAPPVPGHRRVRRLGRPGAAERAGRRLPAGLAVAAVVVLATLLGGVVAGGIVGVYGTLAARAVLRRTAARGRGARRAELLDLLGSAAADLRAGLPAGTALAGIPDEAGDPLLARVRAAVVLAEQTGAPLADVIERIEADARSADRARAAAAAQSAGSRATAWLLAGLPAGGIALGYAIGTDPLEVLLHTPVGAACAVGAVGLQLAGLGWAGRIVRPPAAVAA
jgi:tight adherence protein B